MRVGIYGGTFSPVHNGHVAAAKAFMEQMWLDILYVIPTGVTPHKDMKGDATPADRLEMCRLAFAGMEGVIVSDLEMRREGKSYTVDTLRELYDPDGRLFLLMGTDMLLTLDKWREPEEIFKLSHICVVQRTENPKTASDIENHRNIYIKKYGAKIHLIDSHILEISSSELRDKLANEDSAEKYIPKSVIEYIWYSGP